jgi:ankyrin repeat protein
MMDFEALLRAIEQDDFEAASTLLERNGDLIRQKDAAGATGLHYAALNGRRRIAQLLMERGADVNCRDDQFGATPAGWAIEYLRELDGFLAIELDDLAYAIETHDVKWVRRFLGRFPAMRRAVWRDSMTFRDLAAASGDAQITALFAESAE